MDWSHVRPVMKMVVGSALILLIPLVAMQFTNEVAWTLLDFMVTGGLLVGTGLMYVIGASKLRTPRNRAILGAALGAAFLFVWAELAVGILGNWQFTGPPSEISAANLSLP